MQITSSEKNSMSPKQNMYLRHDQHMNESRVTGRSFQFAAFILVDYPDFSYWYKLHNNINSTRWSPVRAADEKNELYRSNTMKQ